MRIENASGAEQLAPETSIICSGTAEGGGYQADSTMAAGSPVPDGTFVDATQYLLLPGDARTGEIVPACAEPAVVEVAALDADATGVWAIPTGVITAS